MSNHASLYCKTMRRVCKAELINALHQAAMQLAAIDKHETLTLVDNRPTQAEIERIMIKAGHLGYAK